MRKFNGLHSHTHVMDEVAILGLNPEERTIAQIDVLNRLLQKIPSISQHAQNVSMSEIALSAQLLECDKDYLVLRQGQEGDMFYYILQGEVGVYAVNAKAPGDANPITATALKQLEDGLLDSPIHLGRRRKPLGTRVATLAAGEQFGEVALLCDLPRMASVKCLQPCKFLVIRGAEFKRIVLQKYQIARREKEIFASRYVACQCLGEDRSMADATLYFLQDEVFARGHIFAREGAPHGGHVHFIMEGSIAICSSKAPVLLTPWASKPPTTKMAIISGTGQMVEPWMVACADRILVHPFTCQAESARVRTLRVDVSFLFTRLKDDAIGYHRNSAISQFEYLSKRAVVYEKEKKKLGRYIARNMKPPKSTPTDTMLCYESPFLTDKLGSGWAQKSFVLQHLGKRIMKCSESEASFLSQWPDEMRNAKAGGELNSSQVSLMLNNSMFRSMASQRAHKQMLDDNSQRRTHDKPRISALADTVGLKRLRNSGPLCVGVTT